MGKLIARRLVQMLLIMLTVSALLFTIFDRRAVPQEGGVGRARCFRRGYAVGR